LCDGLGRVRPLSAAEWLVYDASGIDYAEYLLPRLLPNASRLVARADDNVARIVAALETRLGFAFHIDRSDAGAFPRERGALCAALRARGVRILNAALHDVTKRRLHALVRRAGLPSAAAEREGDPDERLIVKTNLNYGGLPEARARGSAEPGEMPRYQVLRRYRIPDELWDDPALVIERFVSNANGRMYRAFVAFDRLVTLATTSPYEIKRVPNDARLALEDRAVPGALQTTVRTFVRSAGVDFASIDLVYADGGPFMVVDLNPTPFWGEVELERLAELAKPFRTRRATSAIAASRSLSEPRTSAKSTPC